MAKRKAFPLRLAPEAYDALKRWAEDDLRSMNGQIEYLLLTALRKAGRWPPARGKGGAGGEDGGVRPGA